jgi:hypothetical protein
MQCDNRGARLLGVGRQPEPAGLDVDRAISWIFLSQRLNQQDFGETIILEGICPGLIQIACMAPFCCFHKIHYGVIDLFLRFACL